MKKIIGMYFDTKSYLKSNRKHTTKHAINWRRAKLMYYWDVIV